MDEEERKDGVYTFEFRSTTTRPLTRTEILKKIGDLTHVFAVGEATATGQRQGLEDTVFLYGIRISRSHLLAKH